MKCIANDIYKDRNKTLLQKQLSYILKFQITHPKINRFFDFLRSKNSSLPLFEEAVFSKLIEETKI